MKDWLTTSYFEQYVKITAEQNLKRQNKSTYSHIHETFLKSYYDKHSIFKHKMSSSITAQQFMCCFLFLSALTTFPVLNFTGCSVQGLSFALDSTRHVDYAKIKDPNKKLKRTIGSPKYSFHRFLENNDREREKNTNTYINTYVCIIFKTNNIKKIQKVKSNYKITNVVSCIEPFGGMVGYKYNR